MSSSGTNALTLTATKTKPIPDRRRNHRNLQGGVIPDDLIEPVLLASKAYEYIPELAFGGKYHRFRAASSMLVLQIFYRHNEHNTRPGWQSITKNQFHRRFRNNRNFIQRVKYDLLETDHQCYCRINGISKAYRLDSEQETSLGVMFLTYFPGSGRLLTEDGVPFDSRQRHLGRIAYGDDAEQRLQVKTRIPLNLNALRKGRYFIEQVINRCQDDHPLELTRALHVQQEEYQVRYPANWKVRFDRYLLRVLAEIKTLLAIGISYDGRAGMPQRFRQSQAGRWCGQGFNLQNCTKITRNFALHGFTDFDINACHHAIALNYANINMLACNALCQYLKDKQSYRAELAKDLGVSIEQIKQLLLAMIFGAKLDKRGEIYKILGETAFNVAIQHSKLKMLASELGRISRDMVENADVVDGQLINAMGLSLSVADSNHRQHAAFLFQGIESLMLKAAIRSHNGAVILPLHDGWVCRLRRSATVAERGIMKETGIEVTVKEKRFNLLGI